VVWRIHIFPVCNYSLQTGLVDTKFNTLFATYHFMLQSTYLFSEFVKVIKGELLSKEAPEMSG